MTCPHMAVSIFPMFSPSCGPDTPAPAGVEGAAAPAHTPFPRGPFAAKADVQLTTHKWELTRRQDSPSLLPSFFLPGTWV